MFKIHKFFNGSTRQAMFERVRGYVDKSVDVDQEIDRIRARWGLERIYRFDLGENPEGCSPRIRDYLAELQADGRLAARLNEYPDRNHTALRQRIAERHGIPPEWIVVAAGLDSILDLITRVFLDPRDLYLMPVPSFYLFEEYSERMGAIPVFLELKEEDQFRWTAQTTQRFKKVVDKFRPKLIWIANPNNPTGQFVQESVLEDLMDYASAYNAFVVIDEAYGEYTDPTGEVLSASRFLGTHDNLMVLRTFSKKYGLASLRIGYLMCSSPDILEGIQVHRHHFPVTQLSADLAGIAFEDQGFLEQSRVLTHASRRKVFDHLAGLSAFSTVPTQSSIFMLKHRALDGDALREAFEQRGVVTSPIDISGVKGKGYLRITLRNEEENTYFCRVCDEIDQDLIKGPVPLQRVN